MPSVYRSSVCPDCAGEGRIQHCSECGGSGTLPCDLCAGTGQRVVRVEDESRRVACVCERGYFTCARCSGGTGVCGRCGGGGMV